MLTNIEQYHRPSSLDEAISLLESNPEDRVVLAGGTALIPHRLSSYREVVDLQQLPFRGIEREDGSLHVGALTRVATLQKSDLLPEHRLDVLRRAARDKASQLLRNQATLGGEIARAEGRAELPVVLMALGAELKLEGPGGSRRLPMDEFYRPTGGTRLGEAEILTGVTVPLPEPVDRLYYERLNRTENDLSLVSLGFWGRPGSRGGFERVRVAVGGVEPVATRCLALEGLIVDADRYGEEFDVQLSRSLEQNVRPPSDFRASGSYRRRVLGVFLRRALRTDGEDR